MSLPFGFTIEILREEKDWLVINKPSGLHSVKSGAQGESVEDRLSVNRPGAKPVHRLDQPTSGCLLIAKNEASFDQLKKLIQSPSGIKKTYLALAAGRCKSGIFDLYFSSRYKHSKKVSVKSSGKPAERGRCEWELLSFQKDFSFLKVSLVGPGKRHQIRAGLAHLGHPLRGDLLYGGPNWSEGFGLHAKSLEWEGHRIECPDPVGWGLDGSAVWY